VSPKMDTVEIAFGNRVRQLREQKTVSLRNIAQQADVSRSALLRLPHRTPDQPILDAIGSDLDVLEGEERLVAREVLSGAGMRSLPI
jgi:transcriptional regulator with XRE-family HTH domain